MCEIQYFYTERQLVRDRIVPATSRTDATRLIMSHTTWLSVTSVPHGSYIKYLLTQINKTCVAQLGSITSTIHSRTHSLRNSDAKNVRNTLSVFDTRETEVGKQKNNRTQHNLISHSCRYDFVGLPHNIQSLNTSPYVPPMPPRR